MQSKVYIPQIVERFDLGTNTRVPIFDFSAAAMHGELIPILDAKDNALMLSRLTPKIRKGLEDFKQDDFLIAVGDPGVIAVCAGIILRRQRVMKMLKWDRRMTTYIEIEVNP